MQEFFDIDESYKPWVLKSASKKWKDFKVVLKRKYFDLIYLGDKISGMVVGKGLQHLNGSGW